MRAADVRPGELLRLREGLEVRVTGSWPRRGGRVCIEWESVRLLPNGRPAAVGVIVGAKPDREFSLTSTDALPRAS